MVNYLSASPLTRDEFSYKKPIKGILHLVGVIPSSLSAQIFPMIAGQKTISASPLGSPATVAQMLEFAARQNIEPITETFLFDQVNEAMDKLRNGKPRYRLVLKH